MLHYFHERVNIGYMKITPLDVIVLILCIIFPPLGFVILILLGFLFILGLFK